MSHTRDAQALALSHGAPEAAVDALRTRDLLLSILTEANIEHDIREDVADACEINSLCALAFASGLLDVAAVADLCFLTTDEADVRYIFTLHHICSVVSHASSGEIYARRFYCFGWRAGPCLGRCLRILLPSVDCVCRLRSSQYLHGAVG